MGGAVTRERWATSGAWCLFGCVLLGMAGLFGARSAAQLGLLGERGLIVAAECEETSDGRGLDIECRGSFLPADGSRPDDSAKLRHGGNVRHVEGPGGAVAVPAVHTPCGTYVGFDDGWFSWVGGGFVPLLPLAGAAGCIRHAVRVLSRTG